MTKLRGKQCDHTTNPLRHESVPMEEVLTRIHQAICDHEFQPVEQDRICQLCGLNEEDYFAEYRRQSAVSSYILGI